MNSEVTSELKHIRGGNQGAGLTTTKLKQTEVYTETQYRYGDGSREQGGHFLITTRLKQIREI